MSSANPDPAPDFASRPSPPRAPLVWRLAAILALLVLACAAIWWIDRGAMLTNTTPVVAH